MECELYDVVYQHYRESIEVSVTDGKLIERQVELVYLVGDKLEHVCDA